jgi:hypothetical protein
MRNFQMLQIEEREEPQRGCGFRKQGGLYLVAPYGSSFTCGKLPVPLEICPTCSGGIKPSRGWTWVDADKLLAQKKCLAGARHCEFCPVGANTYGRAGLLWIGSKFYPTPEDFINEAIDQGISRRIPAVPKDFVLGTTVLLAHREAIVYTDESDFVVKIPAVFSLFTPKAVEYVVRDSDSDDVIQNYLERGITPVRITNSEPANE